MSSRGDTGRTRTLQFIVLLIFGLMAMRLVYLQIFDSKYKEMSRNNVLRHVTE